MPRSRRIALMGYPHIVIARGNAGSPLFFDDTDYEAYLHNLRERIRERLFTLFGYCLMRHEIRLIIRPERIPLAQSIQRLHGSHTRHVNLKQNRRGHLFEGRFQSIVIPKEEIAHAVRSAHLWPVRVNRVRHAETYPWSSHRAYVASGDEWGDLVNAWSVLEGFGPTVPIAQRAFFRFTEEVALDHDDLGVNEVITGVAGDRKFAESVLAEAGIVWRGRRRPAVKTIAKRVALLMNISVDDMKSKCRQQDLVLARRLYATIAVRIAGRSVTEVAQFINRDKAQISRLVGQGMEFMRTDETFRDLVDSVRVARYTQSTE